MAREKAKCVSGAFAQRARMFGAPPNSKVLSPALADDVQALKDDHVDVFVFYNTPVWAKGDRNCRIWPKDIFGGSSE